MSCSEALNALGLDRTSQGRQSVFVCVILIYADTSQEDRRMLDDFPPLAYLQGSIEDFQHHLCITVAGLELQLSH